MICIFICNNKDKPSSWLTKFFAGSHAWHIGFVDTDNKKMYDMNLLFRRREWPHYKEGTYTLYECPIVVTSQDLEWYLDNDTDHYGVWDYLWFGVKKIWHKAKRPSFKGSICSEKVNEILIHCGWKSPFKDVPSPTDFEKILRRK
jgi:hypothetical protein